jgi:hypothetical protein
MRWADGEVSVDDAVASPRPVSGETLREGFFESAAALTFGLIRVRGRALCLGSLELLRFGPAETAAQSVSWPIEGGLLAAAPGGRLDLRSTDGRLVATVVGYRPRLPLSLYKLTQLQVHHALVRLQLLRIRGRTPAAGVPADTVRRMAAGAIDAGLCAGVALAAGRGRRIRTFLAVAAGYHLACWSVSGQTLGGMVMRQRVVAIDGSRPSVVQAVLRLAALPIAALRLRAVHDQVAATDVVEY